MLIDFLVRSLALVILLSAVPLSAAALAGLAISILQTATQIQEQSLSFLVKLGVLCITMTLLSRWYSDELLYWMRHLLQSIALLGRL